MPTQYEIDTKFMEFLLLICIVLAIFSFAFFTAVILTDMQAKFVQLMYVLFLILLNIFLAIVLGLFIVWYGKYKNSLFKFR